MNTYFKYKTIEKVVNAINVNATFYQAEISEVEDETGILTTITDNIVYLKEVSRQFPVETTREQIDEWFNNELQKEVNPLW